MSRQIASVTARPSFAVVPAERVATATTARRGTPVALVSLSAPGKESTFGGAGHQAGYSPQPCHRVQCHCTERDSGDGTDDERTGSDRVRELQQPADFIDARTRIRAATATVSGIVNRP